MVGGLRGEAHGAGTKQHTGQEMQSLTLSLSSRQQRIRQGIYEVLAAHTSSGTGQDSASV